MLILLDDLERCVATRPATPGERVAARVRATRLDRDLAAGVSPDSSAALALRAQVLLTDGAGPLYYGGQSDDLRAVILDAVEHLAPLSGW